MIKCYDSVALSALARKAIKRDEESHDFRHRLVAATLNNDTFVKFVENEMRILSGNSQIKDGDEEPPLFSNRMSESEYSGLPLDTMTAMAKAWDILEKRDASEPGVWAYINTCLVKRGLIDACYFATGENGSDKSKGKWRLEDALKKYEKGDKRKIRDRSLQIIRNWSGAREIRGIREMYQNCSPARAWWTCRLASEAAETIGKTQQDVVKVLQDRNTWSRFSERAVSQLTILGDEKIRDGVILYLMEDDASRFLQDESLKKMFRGIGQMSSWRALGFFQSDRVCKIIRDEIAPLIKQKPQTT